MSRWELSIVPWDSKYLANKQSQKSSDLSQSKSTSESMNMLAQRIKLWTTLSSSSSSGSVQMSAILVFHWLLSTSVRLDVDGNSRRGKTNRLQRTSFLLAASFFSRPRFLLLRVFFSSMRPKLHFTALWHVSDWHTSEDAIADSYELLLMLILRGLAFKF